MKTLDATQLKNMLDHSEDFVLIDVLPAKSFDEKHIPGSHNVPHESKSFVDEVLSLAGDKNRKIVVYCASRTCQASPTAAAKLEQAGFTNVFDFEDGIAGWERAGYELTTSALAANR